LTEKRGDSLSATLKERQVVQAQNVRQNCEYGVGDYKDTLSPVFAAIVFRTILSLATQLSMFTDHVDISQAFVQQD